MLTMLMMTMAPGAALEVGREIASFFSSLSLGVRCTKFSFWLALDLVQRHAFVCRRCLACRWVEGSIGNDEMHAILYGQANASLRCPLAGTYPLGDPFHSSSASRHRPPGKPHRARTSLSALRPPVNYLFFILSSPFLLLSILLFL